MYRAKLFIYLTMLSASLTPSFLSAQETTQSVFNQYRDVLYDECWCYDTLIVVPDNTVRIDESVYKEAISFWNKLGLGVTFVFTQDFDPNQRDYVVLVERNAEEMPWRVHRCTKYGLCTLAQFHKGPKMSRNDRFGGYCHTSNSILILDRFYNESPTDILENIAHELGHALGLDHVDGTLMQGIGSGGFFLNGRQLEALRAAYPKRETLVS